MRCGLEKDAVYAEGVECEKFDETDLTFDLTTIAVSTNFDPKFYKKYGTYQLYYEMFTYTYRSSGTRKTGTLYFESRILTNYIN